MGERKESKTIRIRRMVAAAIGDITERKKVEETLLEQERQLALAMEAGNLVPWEINLISSKVKHSPRLFELFGMDAKDGFDTLDKWHMLVHAEDRAKIAEAVEGAKSGQECHIEYRVCCPNGSIKWHENHGTPLADARGRYTRLVGYASDITARKHAEEALQESEVKYRRLHESMRDAFVSVDMEGHIQEFNEAYVKMLGYTAAEIKTLRYTDLTPERWREFEAKIVRTQILPRGYSDTYEKEYRRKDGTIFPVELRTFLIKDDNNSPCAMWALIRDITERKRAEDALRESERRLRIFADAGFEGIVMVENARIVEANKQFAEMHGYLPEEVIGQPVSRFIHPEDLERALLNMSANDRRFGEYRDLKKDGSEIIVEARGQATIWNDRSVRFVALNDITARKRAEEALKEADRKKDEFLAMLAHELRNPMAAISSATSLLAIPDIGEERTDYAKEVLRNRVKQLSRLVDDMLDISRLIRGKTELHKQEIELLTVIEGSVEATKGHFEERGHTLTVQVLDPLPVYGDPVRLEQVLNNILTNAARYCEDGGQISLTAQRMDEAAVIRIRDNGIGMPAALIPKIFDLFGQADDTYHRTSGGLGIGLTIVKKLVELHNGTVSASSEGPGKGSEFVLQLPLAQQQRQAKVSEEHERRSVNKLSILLAEDNRDTAFLTAELLRQEGHSVDVAYDGPSAAERALRTEYDAILLDLGLPGMSGFEVAAKIRAGSATQPKIIAVSGYGQDRDLERALSSGIDYHLLKPIDFEKLARILAAGEAGESAGPPRSGFRPEQAVYRAVD